MRQIYIVWLDDKPEFIPSMRGKIDILEIDNNVTIVIDEHNNGNDFDSVARNIDDAVFLIDYNLKDNGGNNFDGNEVIRIIRLYNQNCKIFFYSANSTQQELRSLVQGIDNVFPILRENIMDELRKL